MVVVVLLFSSILCMAYDNHLSGIKIAEKIWFQMNCIQIALRGVPYARERVQIPLNYIRIIQRNLAQHKRKKPYQFSHLNWQLCGMMEESIIVDKFRAIMCMGRNWPWKFFICNYEIVLLPLFASKALRCGQTN